MISKLRLISSSEHEKERNQSIYGNHGVGGDSREQHWIITKKASLHLHYYTQGCNLLQSEVIMMAVNGLHVETDSPRISHQLLCSNHHHRCILSSRSCKMLHARLERMLNIWVCVPLDPAEAGSALSRILKCKVPVSPQHMQNFRVCGINWRQ